MRILAIVADKSEVPAMTGLLKQTDYEYVIVHLFNGLKEKPSMKQLRSMKATLDKYIEGKGYDYVFCAGETAARIALDTSMVNIGRLRGRDFEYEPGVKKPAKKSSKSVEGVEEA